jgi:hypothetical protein
MTMSELRNKILAGLDAEYESGRQAGLREAAIIIASVKSTDFDVTATINRALTAIRSRIKEPSE